MIYPDLVCALCGSGLAVQRGIDDGVEWVRATCRCGRTDYIQINQGQLDLSTLEPADTSQFEIFGPPR